MYGKLKSDWTELSLKNWSFRDQLLTRVLTAKQFTSGSAKSEESRTRRVKMPVWQIFPRTKAKYYSITAQIESGPFLTKINPYRFDIKSLRTVKMTQKLTMYIKKFPETRRAPIRDVLTCYLLHPSVLTNVFRSKWKKSNTFAKYFKEWHNFINLAGKAALQRKMGLWNLNLIKRKEDKRMQW